MPNTFLAANKSRILSKVTHKYKANWKLFGFALEDVKSELRSIRPSHSRTCNDARLLDSTCKGWLRRYFRTYDGSKVKTSHDEMDAKRISESASLNDSFLLRWLKENYQLTYDELTRVQAIQRQLRTWNGRIYHEVLYRLAGSKREWFRLNAKMEGSLATFVRYSRANHKCRQSGWKRKLLE